MWEDSSEQCWPFLPCVASVLVCLPGEGALLPLRSSLSGYRIRTEKQLLHDPWEMSTIPSNNENPFRGHIPHCSLFPLKFIFKLDFTLKKSIWTAFCSFLNLICLTKPVQALVNPLPQASIHVAAPNGPTAHGQTERWSTVGKFDKLTKAIRLVAERPRTLG